MSVSIKAVGNFFRGCLPFGAIVTDFTSVTFPVQVLEEQSLLKGRGVYSACSLDSYIRIIKVAATRLAVRHRL